MDLLAPISRNIIAPLWARYEKIPYLDQYRRVLKTQYSPEPFARVRQENAIRQIMSHAMQNAPFWRERFAEIGIEDAHDLIPDTLRASPKTTKEVLAASTMQNGQEVFSRALKRLPLLTKKELQKHQAEMISTDRDPSSLTEKQTSGSTGTSVTVFTDESREALYRACVLRSDEWSGWRLGERKARIWGNLKPPTTWRGRLRRALLSRDHAYLDTLQMNLEAMDNFAELLVRKPTSLLFGHANSLYLFATFLDSERPDIKIRPKGIISTSMVLHDFERKMIQKVFDCLVTNRYGCEEVGLIASECEQHHGLHVNTDCLFVEILDEHENPCKPGQIGRVILTDLTNFAMPILRYEVGDLAAWSPTPCPCGRTLPLLQEIAGRVADYILTYSGQYISGISLTDNFAVKIPGVAQMQIVQETLSNFTFNIVQDSQFGETSLQTLDRMAKDRFGAQITYKTVYLDQIPRERSGKFRFCISKVPKKYFRPV